MLFRSLLLAWGILIFGLGIYVFVAGFWLGVSFVANAHNSWTIVGGAFTMLAGPSLGWGIAEIGLALIGWVNKQKTKL
jgi:hypothetical protein